MIYTENNENKPKKKSKLTILGYVIGFLFILSGIGAFAMKELGPMVGLGYLISGLSVFPPFWRFVERKYGFYLNRGPKILVFLVLITITGGLLSKKAGIEYDTKPTSEPSTEQNVQTNTQQKEVPEKTSITKETEPKVEPLDIAVTSQIVKKVNGKCRYFFDIRNNDTKPFEGSVEVTLLKPSGSTLGRETFNTTKPIEPTLGSPVYFDINTCPGGEYGISDYSYKVKVGKDVVAEGKESITDKYENLSY